MDILIAVLVLALSGLILGLILSFASKVFAVEQNEKEILLREALPGANCGACGYAGCDSYAEALANNETEPNRCIPGGNDTAKMLGEILGTEVIVKSQKAFIKCNGNCNNATDKYEYSGLLSCSAAAALMGGPKSCYYGCLGYGDCVKACDFNAITIKNGLAKINLDICGGCKSCEKACPKDLIEIKSYPFKTNVLCANKDKGAAAKKVCKVACLGCGLCAKKCPLGAIEINDNLAFIDEEKCTGCGICKEACPAKCIV